MEGVHSHLDGAQRDTLRAVVNRIIPADDYPNAWDAGVGAYMLRLLAGDARALAPLVAAGLDALSAEALAEGQTTVGAAALALEAGALNPAALAAACPFADLTAAEQDRLLGRVERGTTCTVWPVDADEWFALLVRLTNEGYYADPANGGNKQRVAWTMIGFDPRVPAQPEPGTGQAATMPHLARPVPPEPT